MKNLFLLRHAKSDWGDAANTSDHDRPLNKRGREDAPRMAAFIKQLAIQPEIVYASTAKRAIDTVDPISTSLKLNKKQVHFIKDLYNFEASPYVKVLQESDSAINSILLVAHNPSIEQLAAYLVGSITPSIRIPTACLLQFELNIESWRDLEANCGELLLMVPPKSIRSLVK